MNTLFNYPGGKEWLVSQLQFLLGPNLTELKFYDLFCGGLNVSLGIKNPATIAVDMNPYLIGFYQLLQKGVYFDPKDSVIWTANTTVPYVFGPEAYEEYLAHWNGIRRDLTDEVFIIFYLLTQLCFNGLIRFSNNGDFNVPYGKMKDELIQHRLHTLSSFVHIFRGWSFYCVDAFKLEVPSDSIVYVDPPYSGGFSNYSARRWSNGDRELLAEKFERHTGPIIISDSLAAEDIYTDRGYAVRKVIHDSVIEMVACRNLDEEHLSKFLKTTHLQSVGAVV